MSENSAPGARLVLVTAPNCHLCARARAELGRLAEELGQPWIERDLAELGAPEPIWWEQVPLVLVDGVVTCYWRVDGAAVRAALGA